MQKATIYLFLAFSVFSLSAQTKKESYNSLLWRISGNGLSKPSYVYGTIHITDKRVFHFTDSLYKSLEQSEGFAAELDMSNFFTENFSSFMGDGKSTKGSKKLLIDSLDKKTIAKYKDQLEKEFDKPINKITVGDVTESSNGWMRDMLRAGEMNTFMDAYLFDIARRQGKWVGGIEDYSDQSGLKDSISLAEKIETLTGKYGEATDVMEWMINIYLKQQLESIDRSDELWQGSREAILVRRNIKMARRMDSLAHIRSTLFAVGAAHIPGVEGVINLLRKKGFTVTPVYSKTRISPENYTYKKVELPWQKFDFSDNSYSIELPGAPLKYAVNKEDNESPNMNIYVDLGNFRAYVTAGIPIPSSRKYPSNPDSLLNELVGFYKKRMTITEKNIIVNGQKGKEIAGKDAEDAEIRMQLFMGNSYLFMNVISGYKKNILYGEEPEKFFNSFVIKDKPRAIVKSVKEWKRYEFKNLGFSLELPVAYKENKLEQDDGSWEQKYYNAFDFSSQTFMGIMTSSVKKGFYSNVDSTFFEEAADNLTTNMNAEILTKKHFLKDGYPAFEASGKSEKDKQTILIKLLLINKGPRRYMLFTTSDEKSDANATKRFFDSFKFLPEENKNWSRQFIPDKSFSMWSPAAILPEDKDPEQPNEIKFLMYDSTSSIQVFIDKEIFPAYFWAENDSTLISDKIKTYIGYNDSVIYDKPFVDGRIRGEDLLVQLGGTHNLKRLRALLNGDTLYTVYTFLPAQYLETENYRKLFDEFKISYQTTVSSLYKRKPEALLKALQAQDSAGFAKAKETFEYVTFKKEDVPYLQKALLYRYYDFDSTYYYNISKSISEQIEALDSNHTSIAFIKENYSKLTGDRELLKPFMLSLLSFIKTDESYTLLKELITKSPPKITQEYYWRNGLYDSLALTRKLFPELLSLAGDPGMYDFISEQTLTMLDTNYLDLVTLKKYKDGFIKSGKRILDLSAGTHEDMFYNYLNLVKILGKLNDPEGNAILKKLGNIDINTLKQAVVVAQAESGQQPDPKNLKLLGSLDEFRHDLYIELKDLKKLNLFPKEFLTQKLLAQSNVFNFATDDDYPPDNIEFIGERVETYFGKKQKFYLFKVCFEYDEDTECYLGVAGPYSLDSKIMESNDDVTEIYWDEYFDSERINEWLKDMIKRTEEWVKERDAKKDD